MSKKIKIVHLTSVHPRNDVRIFHKECKSLTKKCYDISLIVADNLGDEKKNSVTIFDVGKSKGRINRIRLTLKQIFKKAMDIDGDFYHFHDPELIPIGLQLKRKGKKVVYDVHEDVPRQVLGKPYLNNLIKPLIANLFEYYENYAANKFDGIVTATPFIRDRFLKLNEFTIDVNNYPILGELESNDNWDRKKSCVCYIGGISKVRGIKEIVKALKFTNPEIHINLAGKFISQNLEEKVKKYDTWKKVNEYGFVGREKVKNILSESIAGLVTLYPIINYLDALPVKMFEYMIAGLPVIASDIPLWREIVEGNNCGICVDPHNPKSIAKAINYLNSNRIIAKEMGENGRRVVIEKYNWQNEEKKLHHFYEQF